MAVEKDSGLKEKFKSVKRFERNAGIGVGAGAELLSHPVIAAAAALFALGEQAQIFAVDMLPEKKQEQSSASEQKSNTWWSPGEIVKNSVDMVKGVFVSPKPRQTAVAA